MEHNLGCRWDIAGWETLSGTFLDMLSVTEDVLGFESLRAGPWDSG
jgi:hypothetical protein